MKNLDEYYFHDYKWTFPVTNYEISNLQYLHLDQNFLNKLSKDNFYFKLPLLIKNTILKQNLNNQ